MQAASSEVRRSNRRIALVPTMGALHDGHLALIRKAASIADWVVTSVFVNPAQFGPGEDFERYPRNLTEDAQKAFDAGANVVFAPEPDAMYPPGHQTTVVPGSFAEDFEGRIRPGHFRGVATVVTKLLNITAPDVAVFGQKDIQQAFIVRKLVEDLNMSVTVLVEPTTREADGLAMSSRNRYLSPDERRRAVSLFRALKTAERLLQSGERSAEALQAAVKEELDKGRPTGIDYIALIDPADFRQNDPIRSSEVIVAAAARFGSTRLIDNILVTLISSHQGER